MSRAGHSYSKSLPTTLLSRLPPGGESGVSVWTSTLKRTIQTAEHLHFPKQQWKILDEIDAGICDGKTYEQVAEEMPQEFEARQRDKLNYRYPMGESYMDVVHRLAPIIKEIEGRTDTVCVVAHQAVLRIIYGHFINIPLKDVPNISIPLHTLIELTSLPAGGLSEVRIPVDVSEESTPEGDFFFHVPTPTQPGCSSNSSSNSSTNCMTFHPPCEA